MHSRLKDVHPLPGFRLSVRFTDGVEGVYDASLLPHLHPAFKALQDIPGLFECARVDTGGYGIVWNDEIDLDADAVRACLE